MNQQSASEINPPKVHLRYWVISFALAGVLLYYSLRGIEWDKVGATLIRADAGLVLIFLSMGTFALFLRAYRWRILLQSEGPVDMATAFWVTCAGYLSNNFLPARAGELVRTMMISSRAGLGRTFVLTTALSERIVDAIALVIISSLILLTIPAPPGWLGEASRPFAILGFCGAAALAIAPKLEALWVRLLRRLRLPERLTERLQHLLEQILLGIRSFHDFKRLAGFVFLTLVVWCVDAAGMVVGARALGFHVTLPVSFLLIAGLGLGSALPSTPGYVGIYQFVALSVLTPFGFSRTDAITYILFAQAMQYVGVTGWGLLGFWQYRRVKTPPKVARAAG